MLATTLSSTPILFDRSKNMQFRYATHLQQNALIRVLLFTFLALQVASLVTIVSYLCNYVCCIQNYTLGGVELVVTSPQHSCSHITNAIYVSGNVALVERGFVSFNVYNGS